MRHLWLPFSLLAVVACGEEEIEDEPLPGLLVDRDGDGVGEDEDCDDENAQVFPGNTEICNSIDDNCDGTVDEGVTTRFYRDNDEDTFGDVNNFFDLCTQQPGQVAVGGDCNDDRADINPGVPEICDDLDNNCDGQRDEGLRLTLYEDADGDGFGEDATARETCRDGILVDRGGDCDDSDPYRFPEPADICGDGIVNICDATEADAIADCTGSLIGKSLSTALGDAYTFPNGVSLGTAIDGLGDLNGDGTDDFLVTAPNFGTSFIVHGGDDPGPVATFGGGILTLDRAVGGLISQEAPPSAGFDAVGLGDMNGDGFDDFMISAPTEVADTVTQGGRAYIFNGPIEGFVDLADAETIMIGDTLNASAGFSVDQGTIDNNAVSDVVVGAPLDATEGISAGTAYIFYGKVPSGVQRLERRASVQLYGETTNAQVGFDVAVHPDLNGDGNADVVVSTPVFNGNAGAVFVMFGPVADGEYFIEDDADVTMAGTGVNSYDGWSVDPVGDVDDDGIGDLGIGAGGENFVGKISVVPGQNLFDADISLLSAPIQISGVAANGFLVGGNADLSAEAIGDLNGDNVDDLFFSFPGADIDGAESGAAYVFFGPLAGVDTTTSADMTVYGREGEQVGDLGELADYTGDGRVDLLVGAPGADDGQGAAYVLSLFGDGTY